MDQEFGGGLGKNTALQTVRKAMTHIYYGVENEGLRLSLWAAFMGCPGREFIFYPKVSCCQLSSLFVMLWASWTFLHFCQIFGILIIASFVAQLRNSPLWNKNQICKKLAKNEEKPRLSLHDTSIRNPGFGYPNLQLTI